MIQTRTPKPLNNKQRKLQYIRKRTALRKGAIMRGSFKTTVPEIEQEGALEDMLNVHVASFGKKWKTPCKLYRVNVNPNPENQIQVAINFTVIAESHAGRELIGVKENPLCA